MDADSGRGSGEADAGPAVVAPSRLDRVARKRRGARRSAPPESGEYDLLWLTCVAAAICIVAGAYWIWNR